MKPKVIHLWKGERIVAVVPQACSGPGWANSPVWVYIVTNNGLLREECIQPEEQTKEMYTLYGIGNTVCATLVKAVPVNVHAL